MAILFWLFVIFIVVGGLFFIITIISGVVTVIKAKMKGISLQEQQSANTSERVWKLMEDKAAKERRRGYAPDIEVEAKVIQVAAKEETPEEKAAREKSEARKRYLDSLVDREPAESEWAANELSAFQTSSDGQESGGGKDGETQEIDKRRINVPAALFFGVILLSFIGVFISSLSSVKKSQDANYNSSNQSNSSYNSTTSATSNSNYQRAQPAYEPDEPVSPDCARMRIEELKRRTKLEQQGIYTGPTDPLQTPCR